MIDISNDDIVKLYEDIINHLNSYHIQDHIERFPLETDEGTKVIKEKYHKKAIEDRNNYVNRQIIIFKDYANQIYNEMQRRFNTLMPREKGIEFRQTKDKLNELEKLLILTSEYLDSEYSMGFSTILSKLKDGISLDLLNNYLDEFFNIMRSANIALTIDDFKYSMFTELFMRSYFEKSNTSEVFQQIFFVGIYFKEI